MIENSNEQFYTFLQLPVTVKKWPNEGSNTNRHTHTCMCKHSEHFIFIIENGKNQFYKCFSRVTDC